MKQNVFRVISKFQLENTESVEEAISFFIDNFFERIKRITLKKAFDLNSSVLPIKEKILKAKKDSALSLIQSFNELAQETEEEWENVVLAWNKFSDNDLREKLKKQLTILKSKYNNETYDLAKIATGHGLSLKNLQVTYELTESENVDLDSLIVRLDKITMMNYDKLSKLLIENKKATI